MAASVMLGQAGARLLHPPFRSCQRGQKVCSVPPTHAWAAAVAVREDVRGEQAQLASAGPSAPVGAPSSRGQPPAVTPSHASRSARAASSPWRTQPQSAVHEASDVDARLLAASWQAPEQQRGSPGSAGAESSRPIGARRQRQPVMPTATLNMPPAAAHRQQQPQRRRKQPASLQRSRQPAAKTAPLQTAVLSGKPHDWQVTRDWLLMEMGNTNLDDETFAEIAEAAGLPDCYRPQVAFYHKLGLSKQDMCRLAEGRTQLFHLALPTIESKLKFLREEAGITDPADMRKLLIKCPRIVEYKTERTLRPRLDFLKRHNIQDSDIPKVVMRAPTILELGVEETLEPRVAFIQRAACVPDDSVGKLLLKSPSLLTCTEAQMQLRIDFLRRAGFDDVQLGKAVAAFPQILYLRVESMEEKIRYLRSIGVDAGQLAMVITRLPQLLSLDIANNMAPKFEYLCSELGRGVQDVASYPAYFSLSMPQRIMPRHRYLQLVHAQKHWPFPMNYLKVTDQHFANNVAGTPLGEFEAFRNKLAAESRTPARRIASPRAMRR